MQRNRTENMEHITTEQKQYVAGFLDGDGCIRLERRRKKWDSLQPVVSFTQAYNAYVAPELLYIQELYGGTIRIARPSNSRIDYQYRTAWILSIHQKEEVEKILLDLAEYAMLKSPQATLVLRYLRGKQDADCEKYYGALAEMKKSYSDAIIDRTRLTLPYLAGFFAAEGSIGMYAAKNDCGTKSYYVRARIGQNGCHQILHAFKEFAGAGSVQEKSHLWILSQVPAVKFLEQIMPYLVGQKKPQAELAIRYHKSSPHTGRGAKRLSDKRQEETEDIAEQLKRLKRL